MHVESADFDPNRLVVYTRQRLGYRDSVFSANVEPSEHDIRRVRHFDIQLGFTFLAKVFLGKKLHQSLSQCHSLICYSGRRC
jgi:hypothetical protein